jgi:hypothetical protein
MADKVERYLAEDFEVASGELKGLVLGYHPV